MQKPVATLMKSLLTSAKQRENNHLVGCLDTNAKKDYRQVVYARVPWDAVGIWFLCDNCHRRHNWTINDRVRDWKDAG
jgi:hypothetical protein